MPIQISISRKDLEIYNAFVLKSEQDQKSFLDDSLNSDTDKGLIEVLRDLKSKKISLEEADDLLDSEEKRINKIKNSSVIASNVEIYQHKDSFAINYKSFMKYLKNQSFENNSYMWFRFFCSNSYDKYREYGIQIENIKLQENSHENISIFYDYAKGSNEIFYNFKSRNKEITDLGGEKFNLEPGGIIHLTKDLFEVLDVIKLIDSNLYLFPAYDSKYSHSTLIITNNASLRKNRDEIRANREGEFYYDRGQGCCPLN